MPDSPADTVKTAAVAVLQGMIPESDDNTFALAGVYDQALLDDSGLTMPAVVVTSERQKVELLPGDTEWFHRIYWFPCLIVDRAGPRDPTKQGQYESWTHEVLTLFHQNRNTIRQIPGCFWTEAKEENSFEPEHPKFQWIQQALQLGFWVRIPRHSPAEAASVGLVGVP